MWGIRIGSFTLCLLTCAVDHRDPSEIVRPRVSMTACIEAFAAPERVDDFYSTALQAKSVAQKWVLWANMCCSSGIPCHSAWERRSLFDDFRSHRLEKCGRDWHILESSSKFENLHCFLKNPLRFLLAVLGIFSGPMKTIVVIVVFEFETIGWTTQDWRKENDQVI